MPIARQRNRVAGKVAAITGAGSGIGQAVALELARRGARVALADINETGLASTAEQVVALGGVAHATCLDVSDALAVSDFAAETLERFGEVHQIYNNAGIAYEAPVTATSWADYERLMAVNFDGVVHGTMAFLPLLIASGDGHVVNVSSLNGYFAQPFKSHYVASKFAVRGFTESLRAEMLVDKVPVRVSVVHPGGVRTNIASSAVEAKRARDEVVTQADEDRRQTYNDKMLKLAPEKAARIIIDGVEAGRARIRVGNDAVVLDGLTRLFPAGSIRVAVAIERRVMQRTPNYRSDTSVRR